LPDRQHHRRAQADPRRDRRLCVAGRELQRPAGQRRNRRCRRLVRHE
jgi:hypothetical protein